MRKGIIVFLFLLILLLSFRTVSADEILFRGLPWGSNIDLFIDSINASVWDGIEDDSAELISWGEYRNKSDRFILYLKSDSVFPSGWVYTKLTKGNPPLKVAGYEIRSVSGYFYYGVKNETVIKSRDSCRLYMAEYLFDVLDVEGAFSDIKNKLVTLYGEGTLSTTTGTAYSSETWEKLTYPVVKYVITGDNDTSLLLEKGTINESGYILLVYGKGDTDSEIKHIQNLLYQESLYEEQNNRSNSTDGL